MQQPPIPPGPIYTPRPGPRRQGQLVGGIIALVIAILCCVISNNLSSAANKPATTAPSYSSIPDPSDPDPNAPVTCNGQVMSQDEVCDHILTINGSSSKTTFTYQQQQDYQRQQRIEQAKSSQYAATYGSQANASNNDGTKTLVNILGVICLLSGILGIGLLLQSRLKS